MLPSKKAGSPNDYDYSLYNQFCLLDNYQPFFSFNFRRHLVNERNREEFDEVSNRRLTSMALDISRGLSYLAELKYVHRDLACRNCLVNSTRVVKLADFGMTRPMFENDYYR